MLKWVMPLLALILIACQQTQVTESVKLVDSTAPGAKYTIIHAGAPW